MALVILILFVLLVCLGLFILQLHLAWVLFLFLAWSGLYIFQTKQSHFASHRKSQATFVLGLMLLLVIATYHFTGFSKYGTPLLDHFGENRRIQHSGYYIHPENPDGFVFKGAVDGDGFEVEAFGPGDSLSLKPIHDVQTSKHERWLASFVLTLPLRVNDFCRNVPENLWFEPGETLTIISEPQHNSADTTFFTLRFEVPPRSGLRPRIQSWFGESQVTNRYFFNQGEIRAGKRRLDFRTDRLLSEVTLREGQRLSVLARNLDTDGRDWSEVFAALLLVREKKLDVTSRIGVLWAAPVLAHSTIRVEKHGVQKEHRLAWQATTDTLHAGDRIFYGLGHRGGFGIRLSDSAVFDPLNETNVSALDLDPPTSWPLPPRRRGEKDDITFILTSESDYIPMDGYWFRSGRSNHPFYAKATYQSQNDRLRINDGKSIYTYDLDERACIGDLEQGVTVKLTQPKQSIPYAGLHAMVVLTVLAGLFLATQWRGETRQTRISLAWTLAWACVLVLMFVRFILAYRVSLLPPADASVLEIQNVFHKSLTVSLLGLGAVPGLMILANVLTAISKTGLRPVKLQVLLYEIVVLAFLVWIVLLLRVNIPPVAGALAVIGLALLPLAVARFGSSRFRTAGKAVLEKPMAFYLPALTTLAWMILGMSVGSNESFLGLRLSIVAHLLIVLSIALGGRAVLRSRSQCRRSHAALLLGVVLGVAALFVAKWQGWGVFSGAGVVLTSAILLGILIRVIRVPKLRLWLSQPVYFHKWLLVLFLVICLLVEIFIIRDQGFFIYGLGFSLTILVVLFYERPIKFKGYLLTAGVALVFLILFAFPKYFSVTGMMTKVVKPNNNIFYRFVALQDREEQVLLGDPEQSWLQKTPLLRNSHHHWQMLLYAAHSDGGGLGYGRAPLTDSGMTYPTSMADCVFSVYLLAEHGWIAGLLLMLVYLGTGMACFMLASRLPSDPGANYRLIPVLMIGGFLTFNALYMASANIGQVIFTGQNIPFLGLYSVSDLLQTAVLLIILTFLAFYNLDREAHASAFPSHPIAKQVCVSASLAALVWIVLLGGTLAKTAGDKALRNDHDFEDEVFKELQRNLPQSASFPNGSLAGRSKPWKLNGRSVERTGVGRVFAVEEQYMRDLNTRTNKFDENGGLYFLEEVVLDGQRRITVNLNRRYFKIRSPFKTSQLWDGTLIAAGDPKMPTIGALGYQFKVSLNEAVGAKYISLDDPSPNLSTARAVVLRQSEYGDSFGELVRSGDSLFFQPGFQIPVSQDYWQIFLNGSRLNQSGSYFLKQGDLLVFIDKRRQNFRRNLMYLGLQHPILSYVQWRNGRMQRMFPLENQLAMAYTLGLAADMNAPTAGTVPRVLSLPLSMKLHADLLTDIRQTSKKPRYRSRYSEEDIHRSNRVALTVIDAFSGHVLAMPDYPSVNPNQTNFYERVLQATPSEQRDLLQNHNLKNHAIGSTIKPLVFSTLAAQFHGKLDLTALKVRDYCKYSEKEKKYYHNCDSEHTEIANIKLNPAFDCQNRGGVQLVSPAEFLTHSRDHYQAVLGMLGLLIDTTDVENVLVPATGASDLLYNAKAFNLDLQRIANEHAITIDNLIPILRIEATKRTQLFRGLTQHYRVSNDISLEEGYTQWLGSFLPSFEITSSSRPLNPYLKFALPEPVILYPNRMQQIHNRYLQFLLGAAESGRWNSVVMAESFARIITGISVAAKLELDPVFEVAAEMPQDTVLTVAPSWFDPLPAPISELAWRRANLFEPLRNVAQIGTLRGLKDLAVKLEKRGFRLLCKTGTINEVEVARSDKTTRKQETETLAFVLGKWDDSLQDFTPGKTLAGFLYLENVRFANQLPQAKNDFARPILERLANSRFFERQERYVRQPQLLTSKIE